MHRRIARRDRTEPEHRAALEYLDQLILDLKLREAGHEHRPITLHRLEEWHRIHRKDIDGCRRRLVFY